MANVALVNNGMTEGTQFRLESVVRRAHPQARVHWHRASELDLGNLIGARHITASTYLRLFVDQILPDDVERVIYLDSDLLVRVNLQELLETDLRGRTVGAARDMVIADPSHPYSGIVDWRDRGLLEGQPYFNAGVLVIDLPRWRDLGLGRAALEWAHAHPGFGNFDQDALNAVLGRQWFELDGKWNVQGSLLLLHEHPPHPWVNEMLRQRRRLLDSPSIVHFSGTIKPWHPSSMHPFAPEWRTVASQCGWDGRGRAWQRAADHGLRRSVVQTLRQVGLRPTRERSD